MSAALDHARIERGDDFVRAALDFEGPGGAFKIQLEMRQFRLLDVVARSERDGGEGGTVSK